MHIDYKLSRTCALLKYQELNMCNSVSRVLCHPSICQSLDAESYPSHNQLRFLIQVKDVPAHGMGLDQMTFRAPFHPKHSVIMWFCQAPNMCPALLVSFCPTPLNPLTQIIDKDVKQEQPQWWALGNTTGDQSAAGLTPFPTIP